MIQGVVETCLYVDDVEAAKLFYADVLGLEVVSHHPPRHVFFRCGHQMLLLFNPTESSKPDDEVPPHGAAGAGHIAFDVTPSDLSDWQQRLQERGVAIEKILDWPQGGKSIYFRDPAGNSLEFTSPEIWKIAKP